VPAVRQKLHLSSCADFRDRLCNFITFVLIAAPTSKSNDILTIVGSTVLLAAMTTLPYLAVWATQYTSGDLLLYCFFGAGVGALFVLTKGLRHIAGAAWSTERYLTSSC
jgi:hypothetical protein